MSDNDTDDRPIPVPSSRSGPDGGPSFAFLAGGILVVVALVFGLIFLAVIADKNKSESTLTSSRTTETTTNTPAATTFDISLVEFSIKPKTITVPSGKAITLRVSNKGTMQHDLVDENRKGTKMLDPGDSQTITVGPFTSSTVLFCSVPGHRQAGMQMTVKVVDATSTASAASTGSTPSTVSTSADASGSVSGQTRDYMAPETPSP